MCEMKPEVQYRPFCSKRCADLDLIGWLEGKYQIPSDEGGEMDEFSPRQLED